MVKIKELLSKVPWVLATLVVLILVPVLFSQYLIMQGIAQKPVCEVRPAVKVVEVTPSPEPSPTATPVPVKRVPVSSNSAN